MATKTCRLHRPAAPPQRIAAALVLLAPARATAADRLHLEVELSSGYESNLNHAVVGETPLGSGLLEGVVAGELTVRLGKHTSVYLDVTGGRTQYLAYSDLSSFFTSADAGLEQWIGAAAVSLTPMVGWRWYGDPERSGLNAGGTVALRYAFAPSVQGRLAYRYRHRAATSEVYSYDAHTFSVGVVLRPLEATRISLRYGFELGSEPYYTTLVDSQPKTPSAQGRGRIASRTFATDTVAYRASTQAHLFSINLRGSWLEPVLFGLGYSLAVVHSDVGLSISTTWSWAALASVCEPAAVRRRLHTEVQPSPQAASNAAIFASYPEAAAACTIR